MIDPDIANKESSYQLILDKMLEGIQIIGYDWKYLYVNDTVVAQSKFSRGELLGHTMMEKYPGIENTPLFRELELCMAQRLPRHMENEFRFPDGSIGWFELSIQPVEQGIFILSIDVTSIKRASQQVEEQNKILLRMNKELEQFTYIASHDLQEPLRTLNRLVELMATSYKGKLDSEADTYLNFMKQSSERMQALVKGLLDYSRIGNERQLSDVDCNLLVKEVIADMEASIDECRAEIKVDSLPTIKGYAVELRLLFQNLLSNAIKFRKKDIPARIHITATEEKETWRFSISDNGIGIDDKSLEKIFIIFKRLHNRNEFEGAGIGLSHCKKIVELHGGEIHAESKAGEGTTFYFTIHKRQ